MCLKIHSHHLHAPLRGIFGPNSVNVARYASLIGTKSPTKCDAHLAESNFQTHPSLYVRDGASGICIDRVESEQLLRRVITVGERLPLPNGATGKVLMSGMEDRELMELLGEDYEAVKPDVDKVRERGYWVSNGEREVGLSAIAAPVYNAKGKMIAAISISGPTARIIDEELAEKVQSVLECAGDISRQMGYFK